MGASGNEEDLEDIEDELVSTIASYREEILAVEDSIITSFEYIKESDSILGGSDFTDALKIALSAELDDEELMEDIGYYIFVYVTRETHELSLKLRREAENEDIVKFLNNLSIRYGEYIDGLYYRDSQGKNYWKNIESNTVIRPNGDVGINHHIDIAGESHEITLSTSLDSSFRLIGILLGRSAWAISNHKEKSIEQLGEENINRSYHV